VSAGIWHSATATVMGWRSVSCPNTVATRWSG
jgi:hypothetical protein